MNKLDELKPTPCKARAIVLTEEDGQAAIRALRRGVTTRDVAEALGVRATNIHQHLGTWAIRYAVVPPEPKP